MFHKSLDKLVKATIGGLRSINDTIMRDVWLPLKKNNELKLAISSVLYRKIGKQKTNTTQNSNS